MAQNPSPILPFRPVRQPRDGAGVVRRSLTPSPLGLLVRLAIGVSCASALPAAAELPLGPSVVSGTASISTVGNQMTVTNSPSAIINWQGFSIGASQGVYFAQQSAASQVLNRVTGQDPSRILGSLASNGGVWLINPHGILFGENARVDVARLVASTLDIANADFLADRYSFAAGGLDEAAVLNQGEIRTTFGGRAWLLGQNVRNEGRIDAPGGEIVLAAGKSVELVDSGTPNVVVKVNAPKGSAVNLGSLVANGGRVDVHASIVNQDGIVHADSIGTDATGQIVLRASDELTLGPASETQAVGGRVQLAAKTLTSRGKVKAAEVQAAATDLVQQGSIVAPGGHVALSAEATATLDGAIDVSSADSRGGSIAVATGSLAATPRSTLRADGKEAGSIRIEAQRVAEVSSTLSAIGLTTGGTIELTGDTLHLVDATVDASGGILGGVVHVGGGWQGGGDLPQAREVVVDAGSVVRANGGTGNDARGGEIVAWSTERTDQQGLLQALDGGRIEVSSKGVMRLAGEIEAGPGGSVLFDPKDLIVQELASIPGITVGQATFTFNASGTSYIDPDTITALLNVGTAVTLQANNDITLVDGLYAKTGTPGDLTLQAGRNINFFASLDTSNGNLTAVAGDPGANPLFRDPGTPTITIGTDLFIGIGRGTATLAAIGGNFVNNAGDIAILTGPTGRWLIYAANPATTTEGFSAYNKHYSQTYTPGSTPAYAGTGNWFLYSISPALLVAPPGQTITYGNAVPAFTPTYTGLIDGDTIAAAGVTGVATWAVGGAISTSGHPVAGLHDVRYVDGLVSGLGYQFADDVASTNELTVAARDLTAVFAASSKVYDATTAAAFSATSASIVAGDVVAFSGAAAFRDKNVGTGKPVDVTGVTLGGVDAANYNLLNNVGVTAADITPATLTYLATALTASAGVPLPELTGAVLGFVGTDALANATTGVLAWATPATASTPAGIYPITGGGLAATNYVFVQAPSNATALTLVESYKSQIPSDPIRISVDAVDETADLVARDPSLGVGAVVDKTMALICSNTNTFAPLDLAQLTREQAELILELRRQCKKELYADAVEQLERDPTLADVPLCTGISEVGTGHCRVTDAQRQQLAGEKKLPEKRAEAFRVRLASLPQIERKIAVLFGVNNYADRRIPTLDNSIPDAVAVGKLLAQKLGYEVRVVKNATKADIVRTLNQLAAETKPSDSVVVYYAGHGDVIKKTGHGYWIPADASPSDARKWLSNDDISRMLSEIRAKQVAMISDSCYSGAFTKEGKLSPSRDDVRPEAVLTRRSVVVMSSGGEEPVADSGKGGHSIFAWYLMQDLKKVDDWEAGAALFPQVRRDVSRAFPQTPQYGAALSAGHEAGGDYLFEVRQLEK